ncbi:hypothetical protein HAX54_043967 [Datura stramonium]|uniref:Uncharacterized protein n=1 Tax=Datura stramonium TaxID=4076 RepID=A0ABS8W606_DATST|nr:hypothetical protein [Datura stramonium]
MHNRFINNIDHRYDTQIVRLSHGELIYSLQLLPLRHRSQGVDLAEHRKPPCADLAAYRGPQYMDQEARRTSLMCNQLTLSGFESTDLGSHHASQCTLMASRRASCSNDVGTAMREAAAHLRKGKRDATLKWHKARREAPTFIGRGRREAPQHWRKDTRAVVPSPARWQARNNPPACAMAGATRH